MQRHWQLWRRCIKRSSRRQYGPGVPWTCGATGIDRTSVPIQFSSWLWLVQLGEAWTADKWVIGPMRPEALMRDLRMLTEGQTDVLPHKYIRQRVRQQVEQEEVMQIVETASEDDATAQGEDSSDCCWSMQLVEDNVEICRLLTIERVHAIGCTWQSLQASRSVSLTKAGHLKRYNRLH